MYEIDKKKVKQIVALCDDNGIRVGKTMDRLIRGSAYASEAGAGAADAAYEALKSVFSYAFAEGGKMEGEEKTLVVNVLEHWGQLTDPTYTKENGLKKKCEEVTKEYIKKEKKLMSDKGKEKQQSMQDIVKTYIDETVRAYDYKAESMLSSAKTSWEQAREQLLKLKDTVGSVTDDQSVNANAYAKDVKERLLTWRDKCFGGIIGLTAVKEAEEMVGIAEEWASITEIPKARDFVKPADRVTYTSDERFPAVGRGVKDILDLTAQFENALNEKLKSLSSGALLKDKMDKNKEIEDLKAEISNTFWKVDNENLSAADANVLIDEIESRISIAQTELSNIDATIATNSAMSNSTRTLVSEFKKFVANINLIVKTHPTYAVAVFDYLRLNEFLKALDGSCDMEAISHDVKLATQLVSVVINTRVANIAAIRESFATGVVVTAPKINPIENNSKEEQDKLTARRAQYMNSGKNVGENPVDVERKPIGVTGDVGGDN